jgi:hypothetical protein
LDVGEKSEPVVTTIENGHIIDETGEAAGRAVLVVPAFEMDGLRLSSHVPRHKKDLARFVRNGKARPLNIKVHATDCATLLCGWLG